MQITEGLEEYFKKQAEFYINNNSENPYFDFKIEKKKSTYELDCGRANDKQLMKLVMNLMKIRIIQI